MAAQTLFKADTSDLLLLAPRQPLAFLLPVTQQSLLTVPVELTRNLPQDVEILSIREEADPVKILRRTKS